MAHLWSQAVATDGNPWQMAREEKRPKQAKTVAIGCDQLPIGAHRRDAATLRGRVCRCASGNPTGKHYATRRSPTSTTASRQSLTVSLVRAMRTRRSAVTYPAGASSTTTAASHDGDLVENVHSSSGVRGVGPADRTGKPRS
jgi:hypothetical protein